jgi:hypothetical protein
MTYVLLAGCLLISMGGFLFIPAEAAGRVVYVTTQQFDSGLMIWRSDNADIWVLVNSQLAYKFVASYYNRLSDNLAVYVPPGRFRPALSFGRIWSNLPMIRAALGYPTLPEIGFKSNVSNYTSASGEAVEFPQLNGTLLVVYRTPSGYRWRYGDGRGASSTTMTSAAFQAFDNGYMIWRADNEDVLVFPGKTAGQMSFYPVAIYRSWPDNQVNDMPPAGHVKPINAFGRVWSHLWLANQRYLGWPTAPEQGYTAVIIEYDASGPQGQNFLHVLRISLPDGRTINISQGFSYANWDIR